MLSAIMTIKEIYLPISLPDWRGNRVSLPEAGFTPPAYSYTFFPDASEASMLTQAEPKDVARLVRRQPDLTTRFLHELIAKGRTKDAHSTVGILGGAAAVADFVNQDCHKALCMMTFDFVPEEEIQRFIAGLHDLGLSDIKVSRWNLHRVREERLAQVQKSEPDRATLEAYAGKYNTDQLNRYGGAPYTEDFRIVDPRRSLRYVGLGNTRDYDRVDVSGVGGFEKSAHYTAPDEETKIALLSVY